jgi:large subunit ribosomal protein L13
MKDLRSPRRRGYNSASYFPRFASGVFPVMKAMTISTKPASVKQDWYVVDASGKTLGRLCTELARRLRGKHKPDLHAARRHRRLPGRGQLREDRGHGQEAHRQEVPPLHRLRRQPQDRNAGPVLAAHPERVIETAVKGMLPKNPLGRAMYSKLKVYKGPNHPHTAQQPQALDI